MDRVRPSSLSSSITAQLSDNDIGAEYYHTHQQTILLLIQLNGGSDIQRDYVSGLFLISQEFQDTQIGGRLTHVDVWEIELTHISRFLLGMTGIGRE